MALLDKIPGKPKTPPSADSRDGEVLAWAVALFEEGRARRRHWEGTWWQNIAFFMGDFWVEWDIHRRQLVEPVKKPKHRVRLAVNLAQPAVRTELAKLTKNRPIMDVLARSSDEQDLNATKVADKVLQWIERNFHMPRVRKEALQWVLICGSGGILVDWDPTALGEIAVFHDKEGNPVFDPKLIEQYKQKYEDEEYQAEYKHIPMGEMIVKPVSPFQMTWDFSKINLEDAAWCIYSDVMDVEEVYRRWKTNVEGESNALPGILESRLIGRMDLTGELRERPASVQRLAQVHQMWIKPGHPKFPDGLCLVFTKNAIIEKSTFDYGHGELPVYWMNHIDLPTSQHSMSILQGLRGPVLEYSKTRSQLIENRNLMANPPWAVPKQLQISEEIQNKPGLRLEYNYMPNVPEPKPITMPEMPKYVTEMLQGLKDDIGEIAGQGETSKGDVPPGARSGVAIAYMQEEDDTRLGPTVQSLEDMMEKVAYAQLATVGEKYDTPRTINIYGLSKKPQVLDFIGTMLDGVMGVNCRAGSSLPRSKAAKQQFILDLYDRKIEQDPRKVRQMLEMSEGEPDEWEVDLDQAEEENHLLREDDDPGVEEWYNHPAHHYIHRNFMKSNEFRELPEEIKAIFKKHDEEHTQAEQRQAAEMQAQQPQGQGQGAPGGEGQGPPSSSSVSAGANGQNVPQGPPSQFTSATSPRSIMEGSPQ